MTPKFYQQKVFLSYIVCNERPLTFGYTSPYKYFNIQNYDNTIKINTD